jgi:cytochrome c peroxidase
MNQDLTELEKELRAVPEYAAQFSTVFGAGVSRDGIAKALAAFQRTLVTRNSDFDRYLAGDESALSEEAREGWAVFQSAGCARCHSGPGFSDQRFHRLGASYQDRGRGAITGDDQDLYAFRTPGLRDVEKTAPYMHDGSLRTLGEVVEFYYRSTAVRGPGGLPLAFEPLNNRSFSEIPLIVAFLRSLSGEPPGVSPPPLP